MQAIDPGVELLVDNPIAGPEEDLFGRQRVAVRLVELATAGPTEVSRAIALTAGGGTGKTSVLNLASRLLGTMSGVAAVVIDAQQYPGAQALMTHIGSSLDKVFSELGVYAERDKLRSALVSYSGVVTSVIKMAVKVDVSSVVTRSAESLRADIARNLAEAGKRLVIVVDHLDRLASDELAGAFAALRMYAAIPYVSLVIALDRHDLAVRPTAGQARALFERLVQVELAMPPVDRKVLARVMSGALQRLAARTKRDLDPAKVVFDEDSVGLALIETPRDAKRVCNALAASVPLLAPEANVYLATLDVALRVLVPEVDAARLDVRERASDAASREALFVELSAGLEHHARATVARGVLRALLVGD